MTTDPHRMPNFLPRLLALIALGSVGAAFPAWAQLSARMGSLSIEASQSSALRSNTNYGVVKQTTASYRVLHQGQPVRFRDADGRTTELSFWDAWTLPDAPRPAVLAANRATYLITEENGEARVQLLRGAYHDNATWQWLDAGGQVGERHRVYIQDKVEGPHELRGGSLLAVSARALLDVKTLQVQPLDTEGDFEQLKLSGGYAAGQHNHVLMYSAAARQVALLARNQAGTFAVGSTSNPEFAMLVIELATGARHAVPFDRDAMRLAEPETDATPVWASTFFEWRPDAQGRPRLQPRKLSKPVPWLGRLRDPQIGSSISRETTYLLMPVHPRMAGALAALIEREFAAKRLPALPDQPELSARLEVDGLPLALRYCDAADGYRSELHLTASVPVIATQKRGKWAFSDEPEKVQATNRLIMAMADKINAMLAKGALQEHFTTMPKPP
ncbi:MAG: hypothetical protein IPP44_11775 [Ideonella sp.]|nr:hypothetical protein [Ideonella sp.]